jgi:predicted dehydrogenase
LEKITVGLVGCGWIGLGASNDLLRPAPATHAEGIASHPKLELIGFYDPAADSAVNAAQKFPDVPFFPSIEQLLQLKPKAIVVASNAETHCELVEKALDAGVRFVLCEKPISNSRAEAERLAQKVQKLGARVVVNHMRRFSPDLRRLQGYLRQELIRDTLTGKILTGHAYYDKGLYHCGTHIIDLLSFLLGSVRCVTALPSPHFSAPHGDLAPEVLLDFGGTLISLKPFNSSEYAVTEVVLYGQKGSVTLKDMWGRKVIFTGTRQCMDFSAYRELDDANAKSVHNQTPFMSSTYTHFASVISENAEDDSFAEALHTMRVMEAITTSLSAGGKPISIIH